jgi:flagellar protein FlaI
MNKKIAICPGCHTKIKCEGELGQKVKVNCPNCGRTGSIVFKSDLKELDFSPINEPYAYVKVLKNMDTLEKNYKVIEPCLNEEEQKALNFIWETLLKTLNLRLDELDNYKIENYLTEQVEQVITNYEIDIDDLSKKKILYYIRRESLGYGKIDPLMKDPHIEDISCDGAGIPLFLYHRKYGSVRSNVAFKDEEELSYFVVRLAQKCGKHISISEPMLDATMPDGSRIQMTLSTEVTTKGSTFTIRKFRADPFTPPDLVALNTASSEILAYFWLAVENRVNALIAGGTASGKTTALNALTLFIPRESKIVSIEETREINLPHPNWIPGVSRSGFGEVVADKMVGEIDMYDLMKAALRQRPEYIIVGEIRGREAYVLFQAMATGHATYSTVHADSAKSLIHRLEGKPIEIPRVMIQSLDIVSIHITTQVKGKRVRRVKQIIEIIDIDPITKEILTNEVFRWDPIEDNFIYTGKSYVLECIRDRFEMSKEDITREIRNRAEILEWMYENNVRTYKEVAKVISKYAENPEEFLTKMKHTENKKKRKKDKKEEKPDEETLESFENLDEAQKEPSEIPATQLKEKQEIDQKETSAESEGKIDAFKDNKSIDDETATLRTNNGFTTIEDLKNASIKDLSNIKGIKPKTPKKIIKELNDNSNEELPQGSDEGGEMGATE